MMNFIRKYVRNREGATAMEFALLAGPFFVGLFAIIEVSYKSMLQTELDNAIYAAAGDIAITNFDFDTSEEFMRDHFCQTVNTTFLKCDEIEIGIDVLVNRPYTYRNQDFIGRWDMGCIGDPIMIEMSYPLENFVHSIAIADVVERDGSKFFRSRAVIRREPMLTGGSVC